MKSRVSRPPLLSVLALLVLVVSNCRPTPREVMPAPVGEGQPKRGGTVIWLRDQDIDSLDPAVSFGGWELARALVTPLLDFEGEGTQLVPELAAEMPQISTDGRVYTFKLRHGVKFTNGREVEAADLRYGLERVLDPKTKSPAASFYMGIAGAQEFWEGAADEVTGIRALDKYTLEIVLTEPNPAFIYILTWNMASPVPKEEVEKSPEDFFSHPVGSGPFMLKEWIPGQRAELVRNPNYFKPEKPHLDSIIYEVVPNAQLAILRVQKGEADFAYVPPSELPALLAEPDWQPYLLKVTSLNTVYLSMNTRMEPLNDVRVRWAINMAIDKDKLVRLGGGMYQKMTGLYSPALPGYNPDLEGYPFDLDTAKQLLAEIGYSDGFDTELYAPNEDPYPRFAQAIQQDLANIGIRAEIRLLALAAFQEAITEPETAPLVLWTVFPGFPDPAALLEEQLSCAATQGGYNAAFYCNEKVETLMAQARSMPIGEERLKEYQKIEQMIMDDAPWVPLYNSFLYFIHSPNLDGPIFNPIHGFLLEEVWKNE